MRAALAPFLAVALATVAPCATAQLYKWVDETGVVNYGDWPPDGVKVLPVTHGTVSSVSVPRQQTETSRQRDPARNSRKTPREIEQTVNINIKAPAPTGDTEYVAGYAPYYGYPVSRAAAAEAIDRPRVEQPIAKPVLPIHPAIPDMSTRIRR